MTFIPTEQCPKYSAHLRHDDEPLPHPELSDAEVDHFLLLMLSYPLTAPLLPHTQFGRRLAVSMFLRRPA